MLLEENDDEACGEKSVCEGALGLIPKGEGFAVVIVLKGCVLLLAEKEKACLPENGDGEGPLLWVLKGEGLVVEIDPKGSDDFPKVKGEAVWLENGVCVGALLPFAKGDAFEVFPVLPNTALALELLTNGAAWVVFPEVCGDTV